MQLRQRQIAGLLLLALAVLIAALVRARLHHGSWGELFPRVGGGGKHPRLLVTGRRCPLLVVLLGPTASGKTALRWHWLKKFNGEIVNCDSVAVYRDFEIGTAKPSAAERASVPHHCIDLVSPEREYSAGDYQRDGRAAIADIRREEKPRS